MRLLPSLLFATGTLAAAVSRYDEVDDYDCVLSNRREMAADAHCGDHAGLNLCFTQLESSHPNALYDCYHRSGCASSQAAKIALDANARCAELFPDDAELRKRRRLRALGSDLPPMTTSPPSMASMDLMELFARSAANGTDCLTIFQTQTKVCDTSTGEDGRVETGECSTKETEVSKCAAGKTCSFDRDGMHVCLDLENDLDIAGIIIAIVFGVFIVLGIATLTWLCCRDRKEQKRLAAKAEATALARAATKKKKADDARAQRAPLMAQQQQRYPQEGEQSSQVGGGDGGPDPFHDSHRS